MTVTKFPDPKTAPADGLLAVGGDLDPQSLLLAYSQGIFPWPVHDEGEDILAWFSPDPRAVLEFQDLHLPRSLVKDLKNTGFRFSIDQAFEKVIRACSVAPRPGQDGTWITEEMLNAYLRFHQLGYAHSAEAWDGDELVGGIYGIEVQGAFAGESMFYRKPNASKFALLHLIETLKKGGLDWMDIQMLTPHMKALGAKEIKRDDFLRKLSRTHALGLAPFSA